MTAFAAPAPQVARVGWLRGPAQTIAAKDGREYATVSWTRSAITP